jgi:hypothetical protein
MLKFKLLLVALGLCLFLGVPVFADGHGPHHGYPYHGGYYQGYHGGYAHHYYPPPYYRPRVVYSAPYVVPPPVYVQPVYPGYGYYSTPGGSLYIQGRNFGLGIGF